MNITAAAVNIFYTFFWVITFSAYMTTPLFGGFTPSNLLFGIAGGLLFSGMVIFGDRLIRRCNWPSFTIAIIGASLGTLLAEIVIMLVFNLFSLLNFNMAHEDMQMVRASAFLISLYVGIAAFNRFATEFLNKREMQNNSSKELKKDIILDSSVISDSRLIDLATSGLLDSHLVLPRFVLKEVHAMAESVDETIKTRGRRGLEVFKKLENIPGLDLRISEIDYPEIKDSLTKTVKIARELDAHLMTIDLSRIQQSAIEGVKVININLLSNALKPLSQAGEYINIKIQRYGKEPRQGVGYLDDGTMVVVNGGAESIGETIKAQVLSVKHTSSGRMIFCNSTDETLLSEQESARNVASLSENHPSNFFAR